MFSEHVDLLWILKYDNFFYFLLVITLIWYKYYILIMHLLLYEKNGKMWTSQT